MRAQIAAIGALFFSTGLVAGCTVEPLNASRPDSTIASDNYSATTRQILAAMDVNQVNERVAQQVRNTLLFALNGGQQQPNGKYRVNLTVTSVNQNLSVETSSNAPTSAQVRVFGNYTLIDNLDGSTVATGKHSAIAAYDRTPQSYANERAERDAENRAAKEVGSQIYLSLAQKVAAL